METLQTPPDTSSFTPISVHQSRTPSSFYSGPAILHYHSTSCKLVLLERDLIATSALQSLSPSTSGAPAVNGSGNPHGSETEEKEVVVDGLEVWVTSEKFLLYNHTSSTGLSIPYPSISLHAIQRLQIPGNQAAQDQVQGLYMQIATPSSNESSYPRQDDEEECVTMTLVPAATTPPSTETQEEGTGEEEDEETPTQKLYAAVSACSNLHPDPVEDGDEDGEEGAGGAAGLFQSGVISMGDGAGGLPPPVDGSSGWITAENMHEFFDEEGNWIAGGDEPSLSLGPGAGTVRARVEDEGEEGADGEGKIGEDETKWRRTD